MLFSKSRPNIYETKEYKIKKILKYTKDIWVFRLDCDMNPGPGEFVQVSIPGIGECPISVASCNPKELDLLIRDVGSVTHAIFALKENDYMHIRGPYGHGYDMDELKGHNIVVIGGGTGTAPVRSVIQYIAQHRNDFKDVHIYFGFRSPDDILFPEDLESWKNICKLDYSVDKAPQDYHGDVCLVTVLIDKAIHDNIIVSENTKVVLCGPPIMIDCCINLLSARNFKDDDIYTSMERHMKCGIGKCGHCMIHGKYCCEDGPVFKYSQVKGVKE